MIVKAKYNTWSADTADVSDNVSEWDAWHIWNKDDAAETGIVITAPTQEDDGGEQIILTDEALADLGYVRVS